MTLYCINLSETQGARKKSNRKRDVAKKVADKTAKRKSKKKKDATNNQEVLFIFSFKMNVNCE